MIRVAVLVIVVGLVLGAGAFGAWAFANSEQACFWQYPDGVRAAEDPSLPAEVNGNGPGQAFEGADKVCERVWPWQD